MSVARKRESFGIGERVRLRRLEKGVTQSELASITGLSTGHISEIESGIKRNLQHKTLVKLSKGLKMSLVDLLGEDFND